ncbi:MAG TPA: DUF4044 domain-containing protein [Anaerolineae bacterium]|nr:DUF4044 domain-containing protein [Anaerolineae bacterium]
MTKPRTSKRVNKRKRTTWDYILITFAIIMILALLVPIIAVFLPGAGAVPTGF